VLDHVTPAALRFGVVNGLALFSYYNGELTRALELNEQALSAGEQMVDPGDAGRALRLRSSIANTLGQPLEAQAALARAIPLLERAGDAASAARSLFTLADAHRRVGDIPAAVEEGTRAAEALASIGDREGAGFAWLVVAAAHVTGGAHEDAVEALGRGLELAESAGDVGSVDTATLLRARVAADRGELRLAAILLGYARSAWERLGASRWEIEREYWEPIETALATGLTADERSELAAQGAGMQANVAASLVREPLAPEPIGRP
jgi:tetratricopeptide (TPR) repeat protein